MLKMRLQRLLRRAGMYDRLKGSLLYTIYWYVADRRVLDLRTREVDFYRKLLNGFRPGDLIFDVGANHGSKTDVFLRLGAKVVAVDPDKTNHEILEQKFLKYRLRPRPVSIVEKAVSDRERVETMWVEERGSAKNTLSQKWVETTSHDEKRFGHKLTFAQQVAVETTTLDRLIRQFGVPYFIKIDVEGFEVKVLQGLSVPVCNISFEVNLPEFCPEGLACVELLEHLAPGGLFNYSEDCSKGLALEDWVRSEKVSHAIESCTAQSIEVFWASQSR